MPGKYFTPAQVTVLAGDEVPWRRRPDQPRRRRRRRLRVGPLGRLSAFSYSFATPGSYPFRYQIHAFMNGQVTVARCC